MSKFVPDETKVNTFVFGNIKSYTACVEIGPLFDKDYGQDIFLTTAMRFTYKKETDTNAPKVEIVLNCAFTKSFIDALSTNPDLTPSDFKSNICEQSGEICFEYQEAFSSAQDGAILALLEVLKDKNPELVYDFCTALIKDEVAFSAINVSVEEENGVYTFTAQDGAYYSQDGKQYIIFLEMLTYDPANPEDLEFVKYTITADTPEEIESADGGEWTEIAEGSELEDEYDEDFMPLEGAIIRKLFETVDDEEALIQTANLLEEEGKIFRCDDDENDDSENNCFSVFSSDSYDEITIS